MRSVIIAAATCALGLGSPALAATWLVGPDQVVKTPSEAARQAGDGDRVQVEAVAGGYYDCAVWHQNNLTIEGIGSDVRITDTTCQGKALFVIDGNEVTIRNLTFARARVADRNGAGIRAEGGNLRIEHSRFVDNQVGVLAADRPGATIMIADSQFVGNGTCGSSCTDALSVGALATLRVENTVFKNNHGRDAIRSQADSTELVGNEIAAGSAELPGYLVELPSGGSLLMEGNSLEWLPARAGRDAAVFVAAGYGAQTVKNLVLRNNFVVGQTAASAGALLLKNWTGRDAEIAENRLPDGISPVSSAGYHWFLGKSYLRVIYEMFHGMAHRVLAKVYHLVF
jgi:hypothetical protein